jgi:hypothetical protein
MGRGPPRGQPTTEGAMASSGFSLRTEASRKGTYMRSAETDIPKVGPRITFLTNIILYEDTNPMAEIHRDLRWTP